MEKQASLEPTNFGNIIKHMINNISLPEPVIDPWKRSLPKSFTPVEAYYDMQYYPDGKIKFGSKYEVRNLSLGLREVVYVHNKTDEGRGSRVLINCFEDEKGLVNRVWFNDQKDGSILKDYQTPPWHSMEGGPNFFRTLLLEEQVEIERVLGDPTNNIDAITQLVIPTKQERKLLEESRLAAKKSRDEFRERMEAIKKAERESWQFMMNDETIYG